MTRVLIAHPVARVRRRLREGLGKVAVEIVAVLSTDRAAKHHLAKDRVDTVVTTETIARDLPKGPSVVNVPDDPSDDRWLEPTVRRVSRVAPRSAPSKTRRTRRLVAIGASTGGIPALRVVLGSVSASFPPVLVVQHIPAQFADGFVASLDEVCPVPVRTAEHGETLRRGRVYVAPGHAHLVVAQRGCDLVALHSLQEKRASHRPSVDVLYESVLSAIGGSVVAALLTGLGKDGAAGLKALRDRGAWTIAQDEQSSVVWGMPGAAVALDGADEVLTLDAIGPALARRLA